MRFLDHTQLCITVGRTPLDKWSARRTDLYLTTHNTHNKYPCPGGIWTHNLRRPAAADLRLRPHGHWDWLRQIYCQNVYNACPNISLRLFFFPQHTAYFDILLTVHLSIIYFYFQLDMLFFRLRTISAILFPLMMGLWGLKHVEERG